MRDTREIPVALGAGADYPVRIGAGLLAALPLLLRELCPAHRYAVIADHQVAALYGDVVLGGLGSDGLQAKLFSFPTGEASKSRATWAELTDAMLAAGIGRDGAVVALGGGVTGDLAGFVAATYLRGLPYLGVPTSLLAMIDSSVGGKTGVDTPAGKNLVGAFHQPRAVLVDPLVLRTLPPEQRRFGLAEAVKHGAIADEAYFAWIEASAEGLLSADPELASELVARSVEIKAGVVARDPLEVGPRKVLNFGHTVAHAVEAVSGYRVAHGEAVALGMVAEARLGEGLGVTEGGTATRIERALCRLGLPTEIGGELDPQQLLAATRSDKKARGARVEYALIRAVGRADAAQGRWTVPVDDEAVLAVLAVLAG